MAVKIKSGVISKNSSGTSTNSYSSSNLQSEAAHDGGDLVYNGGVMDDDKYSENLKSKTDTEVSANVRSFDPSDLNLNYLQSLFHSNNIYDDNEIRNRLYTDIFRFGLRAPSQSVSTAREYLFFTKPDLNIFEQDDTTGAVYSAKLQEPLDSIKFWEDLADNRKYTISALEDSYNFNGANDPFNHLLQNMVVSNLDVQGLNAEVIETPTNMYGVGYSYRGSSEASDDNPTFSLEFKDTRYLDVYYFFKAYEEYETLKHHGVIKPNNFYIINKIIHDQFSIYKFIVAEDLETIIYYGKMYGVMPISLPREVFSNPTFDNGISYSIDFKAAFYEDLNPYILGDFNKLSANKFKNCKYKLSPHNIILDKPDMRTAKAAYIVKCNNDKSPTGYVYKLKWKGDRKV